METLRDVTIPSNHLPATIIALKVNGSQTGRGDADGATIQKRDPLCVYEYQCMEPPSDDESDDDSDDASGRRQAPLLKRKRPARPNVLKTKRTVLVSPYEGTLAAIKTEVGATLKAATDPVLVIKEPCSHAVQYFGQCAICGKDLAFVDYTGVSDTSRATITMSHDMSGLTVSREEAQRLEQGTATRLLRERRLSLIVDLDLTIIHAKTSREPLTQWLDQCPPDIRNDIGCFRLPHDPFLYYVKMRPGLRDFLTEVAKLYELHIYTMGTRSYAEQVAKLIDPDQKSFKERILSRDESGSMTFKNIQRLFPCDSSMVVAIDDRADVWQNSPNLIKVKPYNFFAGTGDINSGMLPKTTPLPSTTEATAAPVESEKKVATVSTPDESIEPTDVDRPRTPPGDPEAAATLSTSTSKDSSPASGATLAPAAPSDSTNGPTVFAIQDTDRDLASILGWLRKVHRLFYEAYDASSGASSSPDADVARILPSLKHQVLAGVNLVFSGVIPLSVSPRQSDIWQWAESFGAQCFDQLPRRQGDHLGSDRRRPGRITHVVAGKADTRKVKDAQRLGGIEVVRVEWLVDSLHAWRRMDETAYRLALPATSTQSSLTPGALDQPAHVSGQSSQVTSGDGDEGDNEAPSAEALHVMETWSTHSDQSDLDRDKELIGAASSTPSSSSSSLSLSDEEMGLKMATIDWDEADKELKEFMGTDTDGDDDDDAYDDDDDDSQDLDTTGESDLSQPNVLRKRTKSDLSNSDSEDTLDRERCDTGTASTNDDGSPDEERDLPASPPISSPHLKRRRLVPGSPLRHEIDLAMTHESTEPVTNVDFGDDGSSPGDSQDSDLDDLLRDMEEELGNC
ncbi:CTD phosphatase Fcp1 [Dimargaris verticillata]|uniref:RNA polymerase II subunit A C-terminal domain phosphatase n=1 Tax=Dimargaris verticillata TaxID=2761393 RepID=A0A9W8B9F8_9FUNG|nr:CTD phosphatase Fcp1 [Dimargaris verticillata]